MGSYVSQVVCEWKLEKDCAVAAHAVQAACAGLVPTDNSIGGSHLGTDRQEIRTRSLRLERRVEINQLTGVSKLPDLDCLRP